MGVDLGGVALTKVGVLELMAGKVLMRFLEKCGPDLVWNCSLQILGEFLFLLVWWWDLTDFHVEELDVVS
jgi:hypothetical protein